MHFAYYNEFDPFAASWLEELIKDGLIAPGVVDRRDIQDVVPSDLKGFTQCHWFAGISVWSLALRLAGWPDDRPIWTGSCPCQPFSTAGKGAGFDDERHLWPAFHHLIAHGKPYDVPVVGEQVASKDGRAWFDLVSDDMEGLGHACGAVDTCAAGFGAPFIGQRLYWLAASDCREEGSWEIRRSSNSASNRVGQTDQSRHAGGLHRLAQAPSGQSGWQHGFQSQDMLYRGDSGIPIRPTDLWSDPDWLLCRDPNGARFRPVEPSSLVMADGRAVRWRMAEGSGAGGEIETHFPLAQAKEYLNRLDEVRGAGNALNVAQATCFIEAVMEHLQS